MKKKPKVIAFYLPQFHRVPENDEWWGEGFTEWVSAKSAKPLFPGHYQPRLPQYNNYYNLLDKKTLEWQADLAKKGRVYGFCIYHYWFGEKQLLEKPAENLLKWKDIDINYCFSWANDSWITSWSKLAGNAWVMTDEKRKVKSAGEGNGILLKQEYGDEIEWKRHFMYLLPFFQDSRYIKQDGKPVFVIYRPEGVPCLEEMMDYWKKLASENGLPGIYFIGTNCRTKEQKKMDAGLLYEPNYSQYQDCAEYTTTGKAYKWLRTKLAKKDIPIPDMINYDLIWKKILQRDIKRNIYPGGYVDFDVTPRKGKRARITYNANPKKFYRYFRELYHKCSKKDVDYIFITAWNEWGEGAYLEPDQKYGVAYLNAIRSVVREKDEEV